MTLRLSIWRQFSSNHSADFSIIGTFDTPEAAQRAIDTLRALLDSISDWYEDPAHGDNPWLTWDWSTGQPPPPSQAEREIGERYGIDWPYAIDWFDRYDLQTFLQDNVIMLSNADNVDVGAYPMNLIMERLGAHVATDNLQSDNPSAVGIDLKCMAPSEEEAVRIQALVNEHIARRLETEIPLPWNMSFWDGEVRRDGARLEFVGLGLGNVRGEFPLWLKYLRENGYSEIAYSFRDIEP